MRILRHILGISCRDQIPNIEVLIHAQTPKKFILLRKHQLRWLGHIHQIKDGRIPKDIHTERRPLSRAAGHPYFCFKDVCKHDMKALDIESDVEGWEMLGRSQGKQELNKGPQKKVRF